MKTEISICLVVAVATCGGILAFKRHADPPAARRVEAKRMLQSAPAPQPVEAAGPAEPISLDAATPEESTSLPKATSQPKPLKVAQQPGGAPQTDPRPKDELARVALSFVGLDPDAEDYWIGAINNPNLSPAERSDLIEDLNEDGLSDPKNPGLWDLPVILNRLALIEELADNALDKTNADAFQEAYKDLVNLAALAMGGGRPIP